MSLQDIFTSNNQAVCYGLYCGSQGGFIHVQNGPAISVGQVIQLPVTISNFTAIKNNAHAFPPLPGYTSTTCNPAIASCTSPSFGGAVSILSLNGKVIMQGSNWTTYANSVSCNTVSCLTYGSTVGIAKETIATTGAYVAEVDVTILSPHFYCGNVSSTGTSCIASEDVWSTQYGTIDSVPSLYVGGSECVFVGTVPPSGYGETVSSNCNIRQANDISTCFSSEVSNDDSVPPVPPVDDDTNSHNDSTSSNISLSTGAIVGIIIGIVAFVISVVSICIIWFVMCKKSSEETIGLRGSTAPHAPSQHQQENPMHGKSSTLQDGLL